MKAGRTIFLSHSSKDLDKVRKIRDILESLDYEPLMFYLKCLDDDNEELEDFIKREIDARNIFIYCKSANAERSSWVQKELAYIRRTNNRRLYTIDIELPLHQTLVTLLSSIAAILQRNRVFISCPHAEMDLSEALTEQLAKAGYDVIRFDRLDYSRDQDHARSLISAVNDGIFMPVITHRFLDSVYCRSELEKALYCADESVGKKMIMPLFINMSSRLAMTRLPTALGQYQGLELDYDGALSPESVDKLLAFLGNP